MERIYVRIRVRISSDGEMLPLAILWEDGREFEIDRILDVRRAASEAGSGGVRYTVRILGRQRLLFYEDVYSETGKPRWFVESGRESNRSSKIAAKRGSEGGGWRGRQDIPHGDHRVQPGGRERTCPR